jgi:4-alpha-glucanotransferase
MKNERRSAGILMPIFSLPGNYGIGGFSKEAYDFVDFLRESGHKMWQILPLGPTSYGDSPYQSFSTFAGNPYFIDLDALVEDKLLTKEECKKYEVKNSKKSIHYGELYEKRFKVLRIAFSRFKGGSEFDRFKKENEDWLNDYALFMAVKGTFDDQGLPNWDRDIRVREQKALLKYRKELKEEIRFFEFLQYEFDKQWRELKSYANKNGIKIIGDIPIYVSADSSDVWSNPKLFELDEDMNPVNVAGCPPDGFALKGQLWGNPLYNWKEHEASGFDWWKKRIRKCSEWYDIIRIDHFRGFDSYYSIKGTAEDATKGRWRKGPGYKLFAALKEELEENDTGIIAEDLGFITESVRKLVKRTGFPNMKVLEFAFGIDESGETNDFLPFNYTTNCIAYTGTHDNSTVKGWLATLDKKTRNYVCEYLNVEKDNDDAIVDGMVRAVLSSPADYAVIPLQDYLGYDDTTRINIPSTLGNNWTWRASKKDYSKALAKRLKVLTKTYSR